jgi:hypothetical protein
MGYVLISFVISWSMGAFMTMMDDANSLDIDEDEAQKSEGESLYEAM